MKSSLLRVLATFLSLLVVACDSQTPPAKSNSGTPDPQLPADLFVASAPTDAVSVRDALLTATPGSDIVVRGVIGGRAKTFVDGRAMFVAIDSSLKPCPTNEGCPTPWDYCCETRETILAHTLTVQVCDDAGAPIATTLKGVHGLRELKAVTVVGSVRSNDGSVVVDAKQIHVEP